jgi:hypothetical protein
MNSYNLGAMSDTYTTGYNTKPRKAKENNDDAPTSDKKLLELSKEFKDERYNDLGTLGIASLGFIAGTAGDIFKNTLTHMEESQLNKKDAFIKAAKNGNGKLTVIFTSIAIASGFLWETLRSNSAKNHNTALLQKLQTEEA